MSNISIKEEHQDKLLDDTKIYQNLGQNVRSLRNALKNNSKKKLTIVQLASITALSRVAIWNFEHAKTGMTVVTLVRLKDALGCSWGDLLDGCESKIVKERKRFVGKTNRLE